MQLSANASRYTVYDIAKWFIWRSKSDEEAYDGEPLTLLKLMKLLYYAEGCSLALGNGSLFSDRIEGWAYGPAICCIWEKYCDSLQHLPYSELVDLPDVQSISSKDQAVLENVYQTFGIYTTRGLCEKTCQESPWKDATENGKYLNREITRESVTRYIKENYIFA